MTKIPMGRRTCLRRHGCKTRISEKILKHFPKHESYDIYIELFFGAGGMYFNKPLSNYNFLNDLDNDVFLFWQMMSKPKIRKKFVETLMKLPIHQSIYKFLKDQQPEKMKSSLMRLIRFVLISNFSVCGMGNSLMIGCDNTKRVFVRQLKSIQEHLSFNGTQFMNVDFRRVLNQISSRSKETDKERAFIYADPPYINTTGYGAFLLKKIRLIYLRC